MCFLYFFHVLMLLKCFHGENKIYIIYSYILLFFIRVCYFWFIGNYLSLLLLFLSNVGNLVPHGPPFFSKKRMNTIMIWHESGIARNSSSQLDFSLISILFKIYFTLIHRIIDTLEICGCSVSIYNVRLFAAWKLDTYNHSFIMCTIQV